MFASSPLNARQIHAIGVMNAEYRRTGLDAADYRLDARRECSYGAGPATTASCRQRRETEWSPGPVPGEMTWYFAFKLEIVIIIIKINDKGPKPLTCHNKNIKSQINVYSL